MFAYSLFSFFPWKGRGQVLIESCWVGKSKTCYKKLRKLVKRPTLIWFPDVKELDFSFHFSTHTVIGLGFRDENIEKLLQRIQLKDFATVPQSHCE